MKYLRKFEAEADASVVAKPNVVLFADTNEVRYNFTKLGVFIQHINGELFTTEQWSANGFTNEDANGVAVIANEASFVISKEASTSMSTWASTTTTLIEGIMTTTEADVAITDYAGSANTSLIAALDTKFAAYYCDNYIFPNGAKGYLPALGEWQIVWDNWSAVDAALRLLGSYIASSSHWSSTQYNDSKAWAFKFSSGVPDDYSKSGVMGTTLYARPFTTLD